MKRYLPINLKFFGENDNTTATAADNAGGATAAQAGAATQQVVNTLAQNATQQQTATQTQTQQATQQQATQTQTATGKSYNQKEYDDMALRQFNAGILNTMKEAGFTDVDEKNFKKSLAAFKKWTDDQKTAEQLAKEALEIAQTTASAAQAELERYKQNEALRQTGVKDSFLGYVNYEINRLAKETNVTFEDATKTFLGANPSYLATEAATSTSTTPAARASQETRTVTATTAAEQQQDAKPEMALNFIGVRPRK